MNLMSTVQLQLQCIEHISIINILTLYNNDCVQGRALLSVSMKASVAVGYLLMCALTSYKKSLISHCSIVTFIDCIINVEIQLDSVV